MKASFWRGRCSRMILNSSANRVSEAPFADAPVPTAPFQHLENMPAFSIILIEQLSIPELFFHIPRQF
jgi:hypothetical protein